MNMRLSWGQNWISWAIGTGICVISFLLAHTGIGVHSMTIDHPVTSIGSITTELHEFAINEGIEPVEWTILWRGSLTSTQKDILLSWLSDPEQSFQRSKITSTSLSHHSTYEEVWVKEKHDTIHQIQLITYPHKEQNITNFIYTWSGDRPDHLSESDITLIEEQIMTYFSPEYQVFTTVKGETDPFFFQEDKYQETFNNWIVDDFKGSIVQSIQDTNFYSVNGYIPAWGKQYLSAGQMKTNVQLSARYNAIAEQTRVTLGYPLILIEH